MIKKNGDSILWGTLKKGDINSFKIIYKQYVDLLFSFGLIYTNDKELIKDSIHNIFVDIYKYRNNISDTDNIKLYLFKSLKNNIIKQTKKQQKTIYIDEQWEHTLFSLQIHEEEYAANENLRKKLKKAMTNLTERQLEGIHLKFFNNLSYKEISYCMNISIESARTLIYRSIQSLRKQINVKIAEKKSI